MENKYLTTVITNKGEKINVFDSREVAEMLGKEHSYVLEMVQGRKGKLGIIPVLEKGNFHVSDYFIESSYKDAKGEERKCYLVTKMGCELLGNKQQGEKGILFNILFNDKFKNMKCNDIKERSNVKNDVKLFCETLKETHKRVELEFLDMLEESLKPFNITGIRQYNILGYRIDYYIPSLNIAIEYDENGHKNYSYEKQEGRQKEIENKLGCRFIRVTDSDSHSFNVGKVIKEMFNM